MARFERDRLGDSTKQWAAHVLAEVAGKFAIEPNNSQWIKIVPSFQGKLGSLARKGTDKRFKFFQGKNSHEEACGHLPDEIGLASPMVHTHRHSARSV